MELIRNDNDAVKTPEKRKRNLLVFSIVIGVMFILTDVLMVLVGTINLLFLFWVIMGFCFLVSLISSLIYFFWNIRKIGLFTTRPLLINLLVLLLFMYAPFRKIINDIDYRMNFDERMQVVSLVKSGELKPNISLNDSYSLIQLPDEYKHLSKGGGEIIVENDGDTLKILFFTFRGLLDEFSGIAYTSDDGNIWRTDFGGKFDEIHQISPHWYWCV